ncbi:histone deacetylase-like protein [Wolffia australiana]
MAVACLNCSLRVPPNPTTSTVSKLGGLPATGRREEGWKGRCVSTMACVILGSAVGLTEVTTAWEGAAVAGEISEAAAPRGGSAARWSDKRECPPWHTNALENIVPENLPRPSARRRLESVKISRRAPAVSSCFSL